LKDISASEKIIALRLRQGKAKFNRMKTADKHCFFA
jgi:hypothetical protein